MENYNPYEFYGNEDFSYEMMMIEEFWTVDHKFKIVLFRMDIVTSKVNNVYNETKAKDKKFLTPVELAASIKIGESTTKYISGSGLAKEEPEEFGFSVFISELKEKNVEIKRGDFVGWFDGESTRIYEVTTITNIKSSNTAGARPFYVRGTGVLIKDDAVPSNLKELL